MDSNGVDEQVDQLREDFEDIYSWATDNPDHSEPELVSYVVETSFMEHLGYPELGKDYRVDKSTDDSATRPDIRALEPETGEVRFIVELKRAGRDDQLSTHEGQLSNRYVVPLRATYGILLDGLELIYYERVSKNEVERQFRSRLDNLTEDQLETIAKELRKGARQFNTVSTVGEFFNRYTDSDERLYLTQSESRTNFYDDFSLQKGSSFRKVVEEMIDLFEQMDGESDFTTSAYDFWERSYARETKKSEAPEEWKTIIRNSSLPWSQKGIRRFMFCLETSYALYSRLILGKACADYEVPGIDFGGSILDELGDTSRGGDIPLNGWPVITRHLIESMRRNLIEGVFEEDIFYWWTDYLDLYENELSRLWSMSGEVGDINVQLTPFGEALRNLILSVFKYDFEEVAQQPDDPLGDLYQNYFDPKTRKALGEFYTPESVVDYMLNSVEYSGQGVEDSRFIDPACGSGTFIVSALDRYLQGNQRRAEREGWATIIEELCNEFKIVGFDVHPFAVLMSQVQFMLVLIPKYKKALEETSRDFSPARLPIFRTNSLEKVEQASVMSQDTIPVETKLPVDNEDGEKVELEFNFPHHQAVLSEPGQSRIDVYGVEEYFVVLQAVFSAVKECANLAQEGYGKYDISEEQLEQEIRQYLGGDRNHQAIAAYFKEKMADDLISKIEVLVTKYNDGRLIKSIEDNVISTMLKNPQYVDFDYVVANPPYVDNQGKEAFTDQKTMLEEASYRTTDEGNWDLYAPFMEKGLEWLSDNGKFTYITPNQYMRTKYGRAIRQSILGDTKIDQIVDFRDSGVFQDVLNYPCITTLEKADKETREENEFDFVRVTEAIDDGENDDNKGVVADELIERIRSHLGETYSDQNIESYSYAQSKLSHDFWSIMPADEEEVFESIRDAGQKRLHGISTEGGSFQGLRTGCNEVFLVQLVHRDLVLPEDAGEVVTVTPSGNGYGGHYEVNTDLLRPFLRGKDVGRWGVDDWSGLHIIVPYEIREGNFGILEAELYDVDTMETEFEETFDYLKEWRSLDEDDDRRNLEGREGGQWEGDEHWYEWARNQSTVKFEQPKIMNGETAGYPQFMIDSEGRWYTTSAYGMILSDKYQDYTPYVTALFNSRVLDFYLKHVSVLKQGNHYKYVSQYLELLPLILPEEGDDRLETINDAVEGIEMSDRLSTKVNEFPGRYLDRYREEIDRPELDRKTVVCDSGHSDIDPTVTKVSENTYHVVIGARKKEAPLVVNTQEKAEFVCEALRGENVGKDERIEVLVPRNPNHAQLLIEWRDEDDDALNALPERAQFEDQIDEAVFDLYFSDVENSDEYKEVIERFHNRFSTDY